MEVLQNQYLTNPLAAEPFKKWYGGMTSLLQLKFEIQVESN